MLIELNTIMNDANQTLLQVKTILNEVKTILNDPNPILHGHKVDLFCINLTMSQFKTILMEAKLTLSHLKTILNGIIFLQLFQPPYSEPRHRSILHSVQPSG